MRGTGYYLLSVLSVKFCIRPTNFIIIVLLSVLFSLDKVYKTIQSYSYFNQILLLLLYNLFLTVNNSFV